MSTSHSQHQNKHKNLNDKEINDFFLLVEERLQGNEEKINEFVDILNMQGKISEEEILEKIKTLFHPYPLLLHELNRFLPRSSKLPILDEENAESLLQKLKDRDENIFKGFVRLFLEYKEKCINNEVLISRLEVLLKDHQDLLEESLLFVDARRAGRRNRTKGKVLGLGKSVGEGRNEKEERANNINNIVNINNEENNNYGIGIMDEDSEDNNKDTNIAEMIRVPPSLYSSPDLLIFSSLKKCLPKNKFSSLIKLLHLFLEGVISLHEFELLSSPLLSRVPELKKHLGEICNQRLLNRRSQAIFLRPMCEINFSRTRKVTGYFELPREYPELISSGRGNFEKSIFNDRLITIPTGSEDDKNPMKKNHYEENLFRCEDQRYELDMPLEIFKHAKKGLDKLAQSLKTKGKNSFTLEELKEIIGKGNLRFIKRYYDYRGDVFINALCEKPLDAIKIICARFNNRIESLLKEKNELEKNNKAQFDRYYPKSFDYRSFKFKNFDKRNNNSRAFLKEITIRKRDKLTTANRKVLRGGTDNSEFFTTLNVKYSKESVIEEAKKLGLKTHILLQSLPDSAYNSTELRLKLPEISLIFVNKYILKLTVAMIYYEAVFISGVDLNKIKENFGQIFMFFFGFDTEKLEEKIEKMKENFENTEKNSNFEGVLGKIKEKKILTSEEYKKYYTIDELAESIKEIDVKEHLKNNRNLIEEKEDQINQNSLTASIQSQCANNYKEILSMENENNSKDNDNNNTNIDFSKILFYPPKSQDDIMFYANQNFFVFLRYLFCIYERLNKLNEYSIENEKNLLTEKNTEKDSKEESIVFKNFIILYKALILKKVDSGNQYEEFCRDILGNESYFLFNMDKLFSSLINTMTAILSDGLSKEVLSLFTSEIKRKLAPNEKIYLANYVQLLDSSSSHNFRILVNPKLKVITIHLMEIPIEKNKKDYFVQFKNFIIRYLQSSYPYLSSSPDDKEEDEDVFPAFLKRVLKKKKGENANNEEGIRDNAGLLRGKKYDYVEHGLAFGFDYVSKKLHFIRGGNDILINESGNINVKRRLMTKVYKNMKFMDWLNMKTGEKKEE